MPEEPRIDYISAADFAKAEAERLKKRIDRREKRCRQDPSPEAHHRLRLAHKALRYASPLLRDLGAPQNLAGWAKQSARAQEKLGAAQDRATALQTLKAALHHSPISDADQNRSLALVEGWLLTTDR
jgi:adenylate cyclase